MTKTHYINKKDFICKRYEIVKCGLNYNDVQFVTNKLEEVDCKNCLKVLQKVKKLKTDIQ